MISNDFSVTGRVRPKNPTQGDELKHAFLIIFTCCLVTPLFSDEDQRTFNYVDLQPWGNRKLSENQGRGGQGNDLGTFPLGPNFYGDARFKVEEKLIQLGSQVLDGLPEKVEGIKVNKRIEKLHFLHATCFGGGPNQEGDEWFVRDGTMIGEYQVNFDDDSNVIVPLVYADHVRDWYYNKEEPGPNRGKVAWTGTNKRATGIVSGGTRIYSSSWQNPYPDKRVKSIDFSSKKDATPAAPFCLAISIEGKQ